MISLQSNVWTTQVPLNVQRRRAAQQHIARTYEAIRMDNIGPGEQGQLNAAALQSGDY